MATGIETLQQQLEDLTKSSETIYSQAEADGRGLTAEEQTQVDEQMNTFDTVRGELERQQRLASQMQLLSPTGNGEGSPPSAPKTTRPKIPAQVAVETPGNGGFTSFGAFQHAVMKAGLPGGQTDPRLTALNQTNIGLEGTDAVGGYAVPPDYREVIDKQLSSESSLLSLTTRLTSTKGYLVDIPIDAVAPWDQGSGFSWAPVAEAAAISDSAPALTTLQIQIVKAACLAPMSDELLEDSPMIESWMRTKVPEKLVSLINDWIVDGAGGTTEMDGIVGATPHAGLLQIARTASGANVEFDDIVNMWSRMYAPLRNRAVWLCNQELEPDLYKMIAPGSNWPAYLPPGGLSASPYGTLMGRPVIYQQACKQANVLGDIILWAPQTYFSVTKAGGTQFDTSIHVWFDAVLTAFRWVFRVGGAPSWPAPVDPLNGTNTLASAVALIAQV